MMITLEGLVLATFATGETSEVVRLLTPSHGRLTLMAKGSRGAKSRVAAALQPFAVVEATVWRREGAELGTLREAAIRRTHPVLAADLTRLALAAVLLEVLAEGTAPDHEAAGAYGLALEGLASLEGAPGELLLTRGAGWLLAAVRESGHEPALDPELLRPWPPDRPRPEAFRLRLDEGLVTAAEGIGPQRWPVMPPVAAGDILLPPEAVRFLFEARRGRAPALAPVLPDGVARQLIEALLRLAERHLDASLRAARFWRGLP